MSIFDELGGSQRLSLVGLTSARLKSITLDDNLTEKKQKRLDLNLEYTYKKDSEPITQKAKISFWFRNTEDITNNQKAKFIDNRGNSTYYIPNTIDKYKSDKVKTKEVENINVNKMRVSYFGEIDIISCLKFFLGYNKNVKSDLVKINDDGYLFIKDWYEGNTKTLDDLNDFLSTKQSRAVVMLGMNEKGYSVVYPRQFAYVGTIENINKNEKTKAEFEKMQSYFIRVKDNYIREISRIIDTAKGDISTIHELLKYRNESNIYYAGLLTEYTDELRESDLFIDFALIRSKLLPEIDNSTSFIPF